MINNNEFFYNRYYKKWLFILQAERLVIERYTYDKTIVSASYLQFVQFLLKLSIFNSDPFTNQLFTFIKETLLLP